MVCDDWADLDRELANYNKEMTGAKLRPVEKDGGYDQGRYEFQTQLITEGIESLNLKAQSYERDIRSIADERNRDIVAMILSALVMLVGLGLALGFGWLALTIGVGGAVSFGMLFIIGLIGMGIGAVSFANKLTTFLAKEKAGPHSDLVEKNFLRSYKGEKEYYISCIGDIHKRTSELRRLLEKVEKKGHVSDDEIKHVRELIRYLPPMNIYKTEVLLFREWVRYRITRRKVN